MLLIDLGFYFYYFDRRFGCCLLTLFRKLIWNFLLIEKQNFNTHDCGMYVIKHMFTNTSSRHLTLLVINFFELNTIFHIICLNYFLIRPIRLCCGHKLFWFQLLGLKSFWHLPTLFIWSIEQIFDLCKGHIIVIDVFEFLVRPILSFGYFSVF